MITEFLPGGVLSAIVGGVFGAVYASSQDGDTVGRTFSEAVIAAIAAAAVAEHFLPLNKIWLCCISGVGSGLVTGYVLDSVRAIAPSFVQRVLGKAAGKIENKLD